MIIAHISDLHLLSPEEVPPRRLANKRFTGWVNLKLRRGAVHRREVAQAVAREIRSRAVDHVVVSGDVSNTALESEFEVVRGFLQNDLGMAPEDVSLVPGNHDAYTRGSHRARRFQCYFGEYITSDLPGAASIPGLGRFPYVRLRGPAAIIGLTSAVPRPPLVASGELGREQRMALHAVLAHEEVQKRTPVIVQHHPPHNPEKRLKAIMSGLVDATEERELLADVGRGLLLHGHLHRRIRRDVSNVLTAVGSTSASLVDEDEHRMGGFNLYEIDEGVKRMEAFRLDRGTGAFVSTPIPVVNGHQ